HAEVDHRVDLDADVVPRDDVLRRDVEHDRAQADPDHAVDRERDEHEAGTLGLRQQGAQPEDHAALVLVEDLHREEDPEKHDEDDVSAFHYAPFRTFSVRRSMAVTVTVSPVATGPSARACQRSPKTRTHPSGARSVSATPFFPIKAMSPVTGRRWRALITR